MAFCRPTPPHAPSPRPSPMKPILIVSALAAPLLMLPAISSAPGASAAKAPAPTATPVAFWNQDPEGADPLEHLKRHSRITPTVEVYEAVSPSVVYIQIQGDAPGAQPARQSRPRATLERQRDRGP